MLSLPCLFLVMPFDWQKWEIVLCLIVAMLSGYLDDRSTDSWGELKKGLIDFGIAFCAALAICQGKDFTMWLPFIKGDCVVPVWLFLIVGTAVLWLSINTTNCSDGIDGLAGTLTMLSLFYLGAFLYGIIGHSELADYLLLPHRPDGAGWAVMIFTIVGALGGYLWHNASPSAVLMGDAGSRFLGLLLGVAVLVSGNPFLILVVSPVVLVNGGGGMVKLVMLRIFRRLGFETRAPEAVIEVTTETKTAKVGVHRIAAHGLIALLHRIRFPLHDHCIIKLQWSKTQVLLRFFLIQAFATPLFLVMMIKLR
jgi:phospho-N-acetylmuramoyl-pentapeptide-transferase